MGRVVDADALMPKLRLIREAEHQIYGKESWGFASKCITAIEDAPTVPQWIPVSERLPEPEKCTYWVCTDDGGQHECRWTNVNRVWTNLTTDWHWNIFDIPQYTKVVAWMPLPEPFKGENK